MSETKEKFDLEPRTLKFAQSTLSFLRAMKPNIVDGEMVKQLTCSSTSVGANFIEANESLSKKDFVMRVKICRKEAKESIYWLKLVRSDDEKSRAELIQEATELMKIFGAIIVKST